MTVSSLLTRALATGALAAAVAAPALVGVAGTAAAETIDPIGPGYSDNHAGVTCIQQALDVSMNGAPYGTYGRATYAAVRAFQQDVGLPEDGAVGPATARALENRKTLPAGCAQHLPATDPSSAPADGAAVASDSAGAAQSSSPPGSTSPTASSGSAASDSTGDTAAVPDCAETRAGAAVVAKATTVTEPATIRTGDTDDPATIKLRYSAAAHCAWAWIGGTPGTRVWLERNRHTDAGISTEPGPTREIAEGNKNTYGAASPVGGPVTEVRACGQVRQAPICTAWFDGTHTSTDSDPDTGGASDAPQPGTTSDSGTTTGAGSESASSESGGNPGSDSVGNSGSGRGEQVAGYARRILDGDAVEGSTGGAIPYSWGAGHGASPGPSTGTCAGYTGSIHPCPATKTVGVDCSGFTRWTYQLAYGRDVLGAGNTDSQLARMHRVDTPAPGDLVFYSPTGKATGTTHVAIYIGDGKIIDAPATGRDISQEKVTSHDTKVGYYRLTS